MNVIYPKRHEWYTGKEVYAISSIRMVLLEMCSMEELN